MSIILFLIILSVLVLVHELGHFIVAKAFAIRVDEFGLGLPPRLAALFSWKDTIFTLNWLPFGGFVKIFGENPAAPTATTPSDSFQSKNRGIQALVLVAGVAGNFLLAWFLLSLGFIVGLPAPASISLPVEHPRTVIITVLPASPAALAGLKSGDAIVSLSRNGIYSRLTPEAASLFIAESLEPLVFEIDRGGQVTKKTVAPIEEMSAARPTVGLSMDVIGTVKLSPLKAIWYGLTIAAELTFSIGREIVTFLLQIFSGQADLSNVTGPVGLAAVVGNLRALGLVYLLTFAALISINLCLINLLPFPALDGGRLFFVGIEAVTRRSIPPRIFNAVNQTSFVLLILLMFIITVRDLRNIF